MRSSKKLISGRAVRPASSPTSFICASCQTRSTLTPRRKFSSTPSRAAATPPATSPSSSGLVALSSRRLISLSGSDAPKFLQGIITQNILAGGAASAKVRDDGFYGAFLTATGRVLHDVFVYPVNRAGGLDATARYASEQPGESFLVEVDAGEAARLERHIKRYKLRARFAVRLLDEGEATVWHAWRDGSDGAGEDVAVVQAASPRRLAHLRDVRAPGLGWRVVEHGGADEPPASLVDGTGEPLSHVEDEEVYRARRYLLGVPEGQGEILREAALPLESNLDVMGGVDFRKGCYVGQELTIRTKHRGVVRKRVLPVMLYEDREGVAAPETLEYRPGVSGVVDASGVPAEASIGRVGRKGRSAGKWLRGVGNLGLGLCRLEIMTDVVLPGETAASSYTPESEFVIEQQAGEDGAGTFRVKAKAFVPEWLRQALDQQSAGH